MVYSDNYCSFKSGINPAHWVRFAKTGYVGIPKHGTQQDDSSKFFIRMQVLVDSCM